MRGSSKVHFWGEIYAGNQTNFWGKGVTNFFLSLFQRQGDSTGYKVGLIYKLESISYLGQVLFFKELHSVNSLFILRLYVNGVMDN